MQAGQALRAISLSQPWGCSMRILALLVIFLFLIPACSDSPVTTEETALVPDVGPATDISEWERSSFWQDSHIYIPCLDETVNFVGEVLYAWHTVATPSGGFNINYEILPYTPGAPTFLAIGDVSGKVYEYANGLAIHMTWHQVPGDVQTQTDREVYIAENGDRLHVRFTYHWTIDANGNLTVEKSTGFASECIAYRGRGNSKPQ